MAVSPPPRPGPPPVVPSAPGPAPVGPVPVGPARPSRSGSAGVPERGPGLLLPAVLLAALVGGGLVGVLGAFLVPVRLGPVPVPLGAGVALVGNSVVGLAAARSAGGAGAAAAGLGWLAVVAALSVPGPGGDLVLPRTATAYAFLVVGALVSAATTGLGGLVRQPVRAAK